MVLVSSSTINIAFPHRIEPPSHVSSIINSPKTSYLNSKKINNNVLRYHNSQFSYQSLTPSSASHRHRDRLLAPLCAKNSEPGEKDSQALQTALRLYTAIKNKNIHEFSNLIGDECQCFCNFFSSFQRLQGKMQVLAFFSYLIANLSTNIDFFASPPTMQDGMKVGFRLRLKWRTTHKPFGNAFTIHISQIYHGKVAISNAQVFLEPFNRVEHFRMVTLGFVTTLIDKMSNNPIFKDKVPKRSLYVLLIIFIMAVIIFWLKYRSI